MIKRFMEIIREADSYSEFSTKGHANVKIRPNDPRFGDNPLASDGDGAATEESEELDEFDTSTFGARSSLDKLHDILARAHISDQEIKLRPLHLSDGGLHKIAARLGVGPHEVQMLLATLSQNLRDAGSDAEDASIEESYRQFMEAHETTTPFDEAAGDDHLSAEQDYLGNLTVRSSKHGTSKFYQGSKAADISDELEGAQDDEQKQEVMHPLVEDESDAGFEKEIHSDTGSYNFPWKLNGHSGFGTVIYSTAGDKPKLKLISVRDGAGDDVQANAQMHQALLQQAQIFMNDA
jgi:hypothetical protein